MDISDITLIDRPTATLEQTRESKTNTPEELKAATEQFEAILIRQYLNEAMKPLFEGPLMGTGNGAQIYQHMVTDTLANELSQTSTFGVATLLNMQLTSPELGQNKDEINK